MKRYIFLDIDGCCNHDMWYYENRVVNRNWKCGDCDPKVVELLNTLSDLDAKVVISSSWGDMADKMLYDTGLKLPIIGHTRHYYENWIVRGNEIELWLQDNVIKEHIDDDYEYVIFDDDSDMLLSQVDNFIHVNSVKGITKEDIEKARDILTRHGLCVD